MMNQSMCTVKAMTIAIKAQATNQLLALNLARRMPSLRPLFASYLKTFLPAEIDACDVRQNVVDYDLTIID
jgi:hypothetical protein